MKYISFYSDDNFFYCYTENGKIYRGNNSKKFTPNLKYFVSIFLTIFLGKFINSIFMDRLNVLICVLITVIGIVLSFVMGIKIYSKIEKDSRNKMNEIFLPEAKFCEYVNLGKKQFKTQKVILFFMYFFTVILFVYFIYSFNLLVWFLGAVMCFLLTLTICWIKPLKKQNFFNEHKKLQ